MGTVVRGGKRASSRAPSAITRSTFAIMRGACATLGLCKWAAFARQKVMRSSQLRSSASPSENFVSNRLNEPAPTVCTNFVKRKRRFPSGSHPKFLQSIRTIRSQYLTSAIPSFIEDVRDVMMVSWSVLRVSKSPEMELENILSRQVPDSTLVPCVSGLRLNPAE